MARAPGVAMERAEDAAAVGDFESWVAARGPGLMRLAYVLTGAAADAEDLVQEALSRALPRWSRISTLEHPEAYVRWMLVNAHTSRWRRIGRRERLRAAPPEEVAVDHGADDDDRLRLWQACLLLPKDLQTAVVLRYYEELEYAEIAAITGVREGSVRSRVSRGIAVLRRELGADDE